MNFRTHIILFLGALSLTSCAKVEKGLVLDAKPSWSKIANLEKEYVLGDRFVVPARTLTIRGKSQSAKAILIAPDGSSSDAPEVTLSIPGVYTICYSAFFEGKPYSENESFLVADKMIKVSGKKSQTNYGLYDQFGAHSYGAITRLSQDGSMIFNGRFAMEERRYSDPLIQGFITPDIQGSVDFAKLIFRFTDCEEPTCFFDIRIQYFDHPSAEGIAYVTGGTDGIHYTGEETPEKIHKNDEKGTLINASFNATENKNGVWAGENLPAAPDKNLFSLAYDSETKQVFANGKFVCDFDDKTYFDTIWSGFPSGFATLKVFASSYRSTSANFCLTSVSGVDLSVNRFFDTEAPALSFPNDWANLPSARYGKGERYPILEASAFDTICGNVPVTVHPFYLETSSAPISLPIKDGYFPTEKPGDYAVTYEARDYSGNIASKTFFLDAVEIPPLKATIDSPMKSLALGEEILLPTPVCEGGSGPITFSVTAKIGDRSLMIKDRFRPDQKGTWTFLYRVRDFLGEETTCSFSLEVVPSSLPIFANSPSLPPAYVSGGTYTLPRLEAYDSSSGTLEKKECSVLVIDGNGSHEYPGGSTFVPFVAAEGDLVSFRFRCHEAESPTYSVPVVLPREGSKVMLANYFLGTNLKRTPSVVFGEHQGALLETTTVGTTEALFGNPLLADDFLLRFANVPSAPSFSRLRIVLEDALNPSEAITIFLSSKDESHTEIQIENGIKYEIADTSILAADIQSFTLGYRKGFVFFNAVQLPVNKTINGEPFHGFSSGKVYFRLAFEDAAVGASLLIEKVGSNAFYGYADLGRPLILMNGDFGGSYAWGSTVETAVASGADTLCPNVAVDLTVTHSQDGNEVVVTDINGQALDGVDASLPYRFRLESEGDYIITYRAKEQNWPLPKTNELSFTITSRDQEKPTISLAESLPNGLSLGDELVFPRLIVKDNRTDVTEIQLIRSITLPEGNIIAIDETTKSVRIEQSGTYLLTVFAIDKAGNASLAQYRIFVEDTQ